MRIMGSVASTGLVHRSGRASRRLARSYERVASGKRINSGRDDAARLAISSRMKAQAVSLKRTGRNIQEGAELAHVADSGLSSVTSLLMRMRELAVQAANDTNTLKDRQHIQLEIDQILQEIERTSRQTEIFGRTPLFDPAQEQVTNPPSRVNVAFIVDDSGSMGGEIANLKAAVADFKSTLLAKSDRVEFGLMTVGEGADATDAADRRADIASGDFDTELAALGTRTGGAMDTHQALLEATGGADTAGVNEPDAFTFEDDAAKIMIVITDTRAKEVDLLGATEADVAEAVADNEIQLDVIGPPARSADFDDAIGAGDGAFHDIGDASGDNIAPSLQQIAFDLTESTPKALTDEPGIHAGIHADETIPTDLPSDVRPDTLGVSFGAGSGEVTTRAKANELLTDIDEALETVLRYQTQAGALVNRLESAQRVQAQAVESTVTTVSQMESADMSLESYELAKARLRAESANAMLAKAFTYQRDMSRSLLGLVGGGFSAVG